MRRKKDADGVVKSVDPDHAAHLGVVLSRFALFAQSATSLFQ